MSANQHIEYATVTTGLRAPRVAVVFPAQANWDYFARAAMYAASNTWGGAGFVLVPATDGNIDPRVRDAVIAYDPDYVVSYSYTVGDLDKLTPGTIEQMLDEQNIDDQDSRSRLRDDLRSTNVDDDVLARTRDAVVAACSSYRMDNGSEPAGSDHRWHEREPTLSAPGPTGPGSHLGALTPIDKIRRPSDPTPVSVSPALTGDIGVAAVMRLGLLGTPTAEGPTLDNTQRSEVQRWLLGYPTRFQSTTPQVVLDPEYGTAHGLPSAWDATTPRIGLRHQCLQPPQPETLCHRQRSKRLRTGHDLGSTVRERAVDPRFLDRRRGPRTHPSTPPRYPHPVLRP